MDGRLHRDSPLPFTETCARDQACRLIDIDFQLKLAIQFTYRWTSSWTCISPWKSLGKVDRTRPRTVQEIARTEHGQFEDRIRLDKSRPNARHWGGGTGNYSPVVVFTSILHPPLRCRLPRVDALIGKGTKNMCVCCVRQRQPFRRANNISGTGPNQNHARTVYSILKPRSCQSKRGSDCKVPTGSFVSLKPELRGDSNRVYPSTSDDDVVQHGGPVDSTSRSAHAQRPSEHAILFSRQRKNIFRRC